MTHPYVNQPYADVTVFWAGAIALPEDHAIQFRRYRSPPALRRGTCAACGVRRAACGEPAPGAHIFYHRRVADAADSVPKFSGYWPSERAVTRMVLASTLRSLGDA